MSTPSETSRLTPFPLPEQCTGTCAGAIQGQPCRQLQLEGAAFDHPTGCDGLQFQLSMTF